MQPFLKRFLQSFVVVLTILSTPLVLLSAQQADDTDPHSRYIRMADNFFILYDPSTSMDVPYKDTGLTRIEAQKKIIAESNTFLPDLGWQTGLYPHWKGGMWLHGTPMGFKPYYRTQRYEQDKYGEAITKLPTRSQGPPMMQIGLMKLEHLLALPGRTEVFMFSDGKDSTFAEQETYPLEQAKKLAAAYDVCFNVISSASTTEEKNLLDAIGSVNACSQVIDFDTVYDHPEHLLGKLFMDKDSIKFANVLFEFDKSTIRPQYATKLDDLGRFLSSNSDTYAVLSGFCDSIGTEVYNIGLSKRRAQSARNYLMRKFNISEKRILTYWYGFANPVASNATAEGRRLNRRVTIAIRKN